MKPVAKKALMLIGILYTATVAAMITNFVMEAAPRQPAAVTEQIRESLSEVQQWAHANDPGHMRESGITQKEAEDILHSVFVRKGTIININYTLIMQCLNFAVLLLILYGFFWDPMLRFLDERHDVIKRRLEESDQNAQRSRQLLHDRRLELSRIREERTGILDQAETMGEQERAAIVARAREEARRLIEQAEERLGEELRRARASLREEVADIATRVAAEVLGREVSRQDHDRLIEEVLGQITDDGEAG